MTTTNDSIQTKQNESFKIKPYLSILFSSIALALLYLRTSPLIVSWLGDLYDLLYNFFRLHSIIPVTLVNNLIYYSQYILSNVLTFIIIIFSILSIIFSKSKVVFKVILSIFFLLISSFSFRSLIIENIIVQIINRFLDFLIYNTQLFYSYPVQIVNYFMLTYFQNIELVIFLITLLLVLIISMNIKSHFSIKITSGVIITKTLGLVIFRHLFISIYYFLLYLFPFITNSFHIIHFNNLIYDLNFTYLSIILDTFINLYFLIIVLVHLVYFAISIIKKYPKRLKLLILPFIIIFGLIILHEFVIVSAIQFNYLLSNLRILSTYINF